MLSVNRQTQPLVNLRCVEHGTFRARSGEGCPACPARSEEALAIDAIPLPAESDDFPAEEEEY
jgi:hypothetical protein